MSCTASGRLGLRHGSPMREVQQLWDVRGHLRIGLGRTSRQLHVRHRGEQAVQTRQISESAKQRKISAAVCFVAKLSAP